MALTDNLLAAYKLDDTSDYSGNSNTLTNTGSVTFGTGLIGDAAQFGNGNNTKTLVTPGAVGIALSDDWTVSFFWKAPSSYNANLSSFEICWGTTGAGNNNRMLPIRDNVNGRWGLFNSSFSYGFVTESITAGNWYHWCLVKSGSTTTFYVNNASKASRTTGSNTNLTPRIAFNRQDDANWWTSGDVDLFYVWNRALDATDRATMYNSGAGYEIPIGGGGPTYRFNPQIRPFAGL